MANAKECDICKNLYKQHDGSATVNILGHCANQILFDYSGAMSYRKYDMCPDCAVKIANFIVTLKPKEETK